MVNWLFARHLGGEFVIRIEDTDEERNDRRFEVAHLEALRWLGLDWDEGPDRGGAFGPYRQSERDAHYQAALSTLLHLGKAYYCFCTERELHAERRRANSHGVPYVYSRKCRNLDPAARDARLANGELAAIRFDIHGHDLTVHDLIKGEIRFSGELLGDFIIVRADGKPTYNFVAAVDDIGMGITHVLRGEDHLTNTPRQMAIQQDLGHQPPAFGHLPLLLGESGAKMSKREGAFSIAKFRREGILPAAVFNYLALLGWSPPDVAMGEVLSKEALVNAYDLSRISHSAAHYESAKLTWFNAHHLREQSPEELLLAFREFWRHRHPGWEMPPSIADPRPGSDRILNALKPSFSTMPEAIRDYRAVARRPTRKQLERVLGLPCPAETVLVCTRALESLPELGGLPEETVAAGLKQFQKAIQQSDELRAPTVYHALRAVLTGYDQGPELKKVVHLLDPIELRARLQMVG